MSSSGRDRQKLNGLTDTMEQGASVIVSKLESEMTGNYNINCSSIVEKNVLKLESEVSKLKSEISNFGSEMDGNYNINCNSCVENIVEVNINGLGS